ncbi:MAG TPA: hypothetical protein VG125_19450 [Pirellulales bacterium]|nr:hypothetical protein [Pirellulales bacterium]
MPDSWKCTNCQLAFQAGWFYHGASPYCGATMLVCRQCGTAHAIEHSKKKPAVKDRFFHLGKPLHDDPETSGEGPEGVLMLNSHQGPPLLSDWDGGSELATDNFAELTCVYCGSDSLTDRWEESWRCPGCRGEMKPDGFWIT